jgi:alanine dehydrogenase
MHRPSAEAGKCSTLLLDRNDIASLLSLGDCIKAVEEAFRVHAEGKSLTPGLLHTDAPNGEFHVKAGGFKEPTPYFALKANAGFFKNAECFGLPNIQGLILLYSAETGVPLAVMDSGGITVKRTGAATAVAARYLARRESKVVTVCGCGTQGRIQIRALTEVLPVERVNAFSIDEGEAREFVTQMSSELSIPIHQTSNLSEAVRECDVCVTCTPSRKFFIEQSYVAPGTLVIAMGADSPEKQEIDPRLVATSAVVVDLLAQCVEVGELHHAVMAGLMKPDEVRAELGDIIAGHAPGRVSEEEIVVFDSTGTALQDAAAAVLAYERATAAGRGRLFEFR